MGYDISVLRAILRLARRRLGADLEQISLRVSGEETDVRAAIRRLARAGLVDAKGRDVRLTMSGLAVAVASLPAIGAPKERPAKRMGTKRVTKRRAA